MSGVNGRDSTVLGWQEPQILGLGFLLNTSVSQLVQGLTSTWRNLLCFFLTTASTC